MSVFATRDMVSGHGICGGGIDTQSVRQGVTYSTHKMRLRGQVDGKHGIWGRFTRKGAENKKFRGNNCCQMSPAFV